MSGRTSDGLAGMPTGPELSARLALLDPRDADDCELLDLLIAHTRQLAYQQAQQWAVMAEIATRDPMPNLPGRAPWTPDEIFESAVDEIRAELLLTRRAARTELENATVVEALPRVQQALRDGVIDRRRAIVLADGCLDLTDAQRSALLDEVMPHAARVTATRLAEKVQRAAVALDPAWAERRYRQAVRERKVVGYLNRDGSATVSGQNLPADEAAAACARVDALADAARRAGAAAKIDHLRVELFLGLLGGRFGDMPEADIVAELLRQFPRPAEQGAEDACDPGSAGRRAASAAKEAGKPTTLWSGGVHLRVGLGTLLGLDDHPGEIAGWGIVTAPIARHIAAQQRRSEWRFAILDEDGRVLFDGITRRRPRGDEAARVPGGIVELHVPLALISDDSTAGRYPDWAGLLGDLAAQFARQEPIEQDPSARFPGRPLRRRTQTQFQRCIFPGCRRPASDCDLDHRREHGRGGRTDEENMGPGCRHDHQLKTSGGWRLVRRDSTTFVWISPLGRRHVVKVEPVAPPLPAPIPRPQPVDPVILDNPFQPPPSFQPCDRRGRPVRSAAGPTEVGRAQVDADPPPF